MPNCMLVELMSYQAGVWVFITKEQYEALAALEDNSIPYSLCTFKAEDGYKILYGIKRG